MRVCVLGAGVIGAITAYFLRRDGHEVTLIDRAHAPARETSYANGGQISVSHTDPWASPRNLKKVIGWLGKADAPLRFKLSTDPALWRWLWLYLRNCTEERARQNTRKMLRIATYSQGVLADLQRDVVTEYDARRTGILHIYRDPASYDAALRQAEFVTGLGCRREPISIARMIEIEPALAPSAEGLVGVIYAPSDETGDARKFTDGILAAFEALGGAARLNAPIQGVTVGGNEVCSVHLQDGEMIGCDAVVCALGSYSGPFLKKLGLSLPIYPAKGYSVTLPVGGSNAAPVTALIDDEKKLVYSRLGDRLRIAGMAETVGYDRTIDEARARLVLKGALELFPGAGDPSRAEFWTGLRPQMPDSVPVLGRTPIKGLYLNTGHGTLGWTMAAGSARVVADLVDGRIPEIDLAGLGIERFG